MKIVSALFARNAAEVPLKLQVAGVLAEKTASVHLPVAELVRGRVRSADPLDSEQARRLQSERRPVAERAAPSYVLKQKL